MQNLKLISNEYVSIFYTIVGRCKSSSFYCRHVRWTICWKTGNVIKFEKNHKVDLNLSQLINVQSTSLDKQFVYNGRYAALDKLSPLVNSFKNLLIPKILPSLVTREGAFPHMVYGSFESVYFVCILVLSSHQKG